MKILLIPGNNSLSHVAKCAALASTFGQRGHRVLIAVTRRHIGFIRRLGLPGVVLPDIQEADDGALPSLAWFRSPEVLTACIQAEIELIRSFRPHRVVGVFRFTLKASAAALGVPYDAVACGCMMPDMTEPLGFGPGEGGIGEQALYLNNFYRYAGRRMSAAMARLGLPPVDDLRELLVGDRTFLWDDPHFMPLPGRLGRYHVGPISWERWPDISEPPAPFAEEGRPLAVVSLGTRQTTRAVALKISKCLMACGYNVMVACGGHAALMDLIPEAPALRCWRFAPLARLLGRAQLLVCHGGQMSIFEALLQQVPVLVVPAHPEQAHNGLCLERIDCGGRLIRPIPFKGDPLAYTDAFIRQPDTEIIARIKALTSGHRLHQGVMLARSRLQNYNAPVMMADFLEGN